MIKTILNNYLYTKDKINYFSLNFSSCLEKNLIGQIRGLDNFLKHIPSADKQTFDQTKIKINSIGLVYHYFLFLESILDIDPDFSPKLFLNQLTSQDLAVEKAFLLGYKWLDKDVDKISKTEKQIRLIFWEQKVYQVYFDFSHWSDKNLDLDIRPYSFVWKIG